MKKITQPSGDELLVVSVSDLQKNMIQIAKYLREGCFVEIRKHNIKLGMIVPY